MIDQKAIRDRMLSRINNVRNRRLYKSIPRLSLEQIKTLAANPQMMDEYIKKYGIDIVKTMLEGGENAI